MNRAIAPETDAVTIARRRLPPLAACRGISPPPVDRARPGRFFNSRQAAYRAVKIFHARPDQRLHLPTLDRRLAQIGQSNIICKVFL